MVAVERIMQFLQIQPQRDVLPIPEAAGTTTAVRSDPLLPGSPASSSSARLNSLAGGSTGQISTTAGSGGGLSKGTLATIGPRISDDHQVRSSRHLDGVSLHSNDVISSPPALQIQVSYMPLMFSFPKDSIPI